MQYYLPNELVPQKQIESFINVGKLCQGRQTLVKSELILFKRLKNILEEDFSVNLEDTPSRTLNEEETIAELQQEELVWRQEMDVYQQELYDFDAGDLPAYIGNDLVEEKDVEPPREVATLHDVMDDNDEINKKPAAKKTQGKTSMNFVFLLNCFHDI